MTKLASPAEVFAPATRSVCVMRWILQTGRAAISCEVGMNPDRSFDLRVVPSWQPGKAIVEHFTSALPAMKRHAQLAGQLRDLGWAVTERASAWPPRAYLR